MAQRGFSERELERLRLMGFDTILKKLTSGFNYYPNSIEGQFQDTIYLPIKFGHRNTIFLSLLEKEVEKEFHSHVRCLRVPRKAIYQWFKSYNFPHPEKRIRIYDVEQKKHILNIEEYKQSSGKLLAEGEEESLVFEPKTVNLATLAIFLIKKGSFFITDSEGNLIPSLEDSEYPFKVNPDKISDEAYMTPMIITTFNKDLQAQLPSFAPVKKVFKIKGKEEIGTYLDKLYPNFIENCKIKFDGEKDRLVNKLFRDFINFESQIELA